MNVSFLADAWAVGSPSLLGVLGGAGILIVALIVMTRLVNDELEEQPSAGVRGTLAQIRGLRSEVQRRLDAVSPARRAVFEHLFAPVLCDFDRQVEQREREASAVAPDAERHTASRTELEARLARETDPRAVHLLEASLADLAEVVRADVEYAQRAHVAELELVRLRTLLERLNAQLEGVERDSGSANWEQGLVTQFEHALHATRDVLEA